MRIADQHGSAGLVFRSLDEHRGTRDANSLCSPRSKMQFYSDMDQIVHYTELCEGGEHSCSLVLLTEIRRLYITVPRPSQLESFPQA